MAAWLMIHAYAVWVLVAWEQPLLSLLVVAVQSWLSVGLFIIAHDAMHGSLAPGAPHLSRVIGEICLRLFVGFSYARLYPAHHAHHEHVGTRDDPDFDADHPRSFARWYWKFMREYLDWYFFWVTGALAIGYFVLLYQVGGIERAVHILFWVVPCILASLQLFYFGTFRPHRHVEGEGFADRHNSRSNDFSPLASLLTCFHFGYHHEHHLHPGTPWWGLPKVRREKTR